MISLQAQIQQMGIGAAGANGEVRYGSMFNDFDNDIMSKIKIYPNIMQNSNIHAWVEMQWKKLTNPKPFSKAWTNRMNLWQT